MQSCQLGQEAVHGVSFKSHEATHRARHIMGVARIWKGGFPPTLKKGAGTLLCEYMHASVLDLCRLALIEKSGSQYYIHTALKSTCSLRPSSMRRRGSARLPRHRRSTVSLGIQPSYTSYYAVWLALVLPHVFHQCKNPAHFFARRGISGQPGTPWLCPCTCIYCSAIPEVT
jgi:hypothetical protein